LLNNFPNRFQNHLVAKKREEVPDEKVLGLVRLKCQQRRRLEKRMGLSLLEAEQRGEKKKRAGEVENAV
jgi:hypothetical protein